MRSSTRDDILILTEAATAVALSVLLGNLRLLELPSGGSITLACVPLLAFAALRGVRHGLLVCVCAGFAHALNGGTIVHPLQLVFDYGIAYAAYACAGFAPTATGWRLRTAICAAGVVQLTATTISGAVFFAQGFSTTAGAVRYALAYNSVTIIPEVLLALALVPLAARAINRADPARARVVTGAPLHAAPLRVPRRAPMLHARVSTRTPAARTESHRLSAARLQHETARLAEPARRTPPHASPHAAAFVRPSPFARSQRVTRDVS